jgi:hypothetical protein
MNDIERARDRRDDKAGPWEVCRIMCLVCQFRYVSVHPLYKNDEGDLVDLTTLQCARCKERMSAVLPMPDEPPPGDSDAPPDEPATDVAAGASVGDSPTRSTPCPSDP